MNIDSAANPWASIVQRCSTDHTFRRRLLADPVAALKAQGIAVADGVELRILEDTDALRHLVIPARPSAELSDAALDAVTGGTNVSLVNNLAKVFGWSPKQVNQILGRGDVPYTGGGGEPHTSSDTGAE